MQYSSLGWPQYLTFLLFVCVLSGIVVYMSRCIYCRRRIRELQETMKCHVFQDPGWKLSRLYDMISYWENTVVEQTFDVCFYDDREEGA